MKGDDVALYSSSTLALDAGTGKLAWYYSHAPGEAFDLDVVFERVLIDAGDEKWVLSVGKDGILWKHDRKTGVYIDHAETRLPERVGELRSRDRHGRAIGRTSSTRKVGEWVDACPSTAGGKNWHPMSFHRPSRQVIIPL